MTVAFYAILGCAVVAGSSGAAGALLFDRDPREYIPLLVGAALVSMVAAAVRSGERWSRLFVIWTGAGVAVAGPVLAVRALRALSAEGQVPMPTWLFGLVGLPILSALAGLAAGMLAGDGVVAELERRRRGADRSSTP